MKILRLTLKKKWFDMIVSGEKTEEYREIKPYWFERFVLHHIKPYEYCTPFKWINKEKRFEGVKYVCSQKKSMIAFIPFTHIEFKNGYSKNAPTILLECKGIEIKTGNTDWGAIKNEIYFVIKLGKKNSIN